MHSRQSPDFFFCWFRTEREAERERERAEWMFNVQWSEKKKSRYFWICSNLMTTTKKFLGYLLLCQGTHMCLRSMFHIHMYMRSDQILFGFFLSIPYYARLMIGFTDVFFLVTFFVIGVTIRIELINNLSFPEWRQMYNEGISFIGITH